MFFPGGLTFWFHILVQIIFNMKTLFGKCVIAIILLATPSIITASSFTLPGEVWGRLDVTREKGNIAQGDIQQGIKFKVFPYLIPYVGATHYSIIDGDSATYVKYGVKTEFLHPFTLGIEKQHYVYSNPDLSDAVTGYISMFKDWEFLK